MAGAHSMSDCIDDHLDNEFIFLAQFIHSSIQRVAPIDKPLCVAWLKRLLHRPHDGTPKDVRNVYLAELLLAMNSGSLSGPFEDHPVEEGALPAVFNRCFKLTEPSWLDTIVNKPNPEGDDADERTYIATQSHPDGKSMYAYVAVSTTDDAHWIDAEERDVSVRLQPDESCSFANRSPRDPDIPVENCESCSCINPTLECTELPCTSSSRLKQDTNSNNSGECSSQSESIRRAPDEKSNPLVNFYNELLSLIDCVMRTGCCSDDEYITQLIERLKIESADPALLALPRDELRYELLRRLKIKILTRLEQAKRCELNETASCHSSKPHPGTSPQDNPPEVDLCLDEELWESAARRELNPTNMMLLESVYPSVLVDRFVDVLIRERCAFISNLRSEHEVLVSALRTDLEKDVKASLERYREARGLWLLLLKATQEIQETRRNEVADSDVEISLRETVRELQDAMVALLEEGARGAALADQLVAEHQSLHVTERDGACLTQRLLADNDALRLRIQVLQAQEVAQRRRIEELDHQLTIER